MERTQHRNVNSSHHINHYYYYQHDHRRCWQRGRNGHGEGVSRLSAGPYRPTSYAEGKTKSVEEKEDVTVCWAVSPHQSENSVNNYMEEV